MGVSQVLGYPLGGEVVDKQYGNEELGEILYINK